MPEPASKISAELPSHLLGHMVSSASSTSTASSKPAAGGNWAQLKKKLDTSDPPSSRPLRQKPTKPSRSRLSGISAFARQTAHDLPESTPGAGPSRIVAVDVPAPVTEGVVFLPPPNDTPLLFELRQMVAGKNILNEAKRAPGNYIAIDCEMVGLGHLGSESALARVSLINYHGHTLLDTFVQPRERVTDWRTWVSGVREEDLLGAPEFGEVQKRVSEIVKGRVLVGHAIENDLHALLLDHPGPMTRDTQKCKTLREIAKNKRPGLKKLCAIELGLEIQKASHSSVTDARATMALYRLHKVEWERSLRLTTEAWKVKNGIVDVRGGGSGKRKRSGDEDGEGDGDGEEEVGERGKKRDVGQGRKGISSGLSVVVKHHGKKGGGLDVGKRGMVKQDGGDNHRTRGSAGGTTGDTGAGNWWEQAVN